MKIRIVTTTEYVGESSILEESFSLDVEGQTGDSGVDVANTYLKVREILKAGLKKKEGS